MRRYPTFLFFILLLANIVASETNRTIDDTLGDSVTGAKVQYLPTNFAPAGGRVWKESSSCTNCAITPDTSQAFDNTWTSGTYFSEMGSMSASFNFEGTAIYIYLIQSNYPTSTGLVSSTSCDFQLDGQVVGNYQHTTDGTYTFQYNVLAFSSTSLTDGQHTFLIETSGPDSEYVIFDYAIYTTNTQAVTTSNAPSTPTSTPASPSTSTSNSPTNSNSPLNSTSPSDPSSTPISNPTFISTFISHSAAPSPSSSSNSSSNSTTGSNSNSASSHLATARKDSSPIGAIVGGAIGGIAVIALVFLALALCRRQKRRQYVSFVGAGQPRSVVDLSESIPGPQITDLQHQITERQYEMSQLERTGDGADVRQQMEEMREQIRRLESQQQLSLNSESRGGTTLSSSSRSMTTESHGRPRSTRKLEQPSPRQNRPELELLIHSDSGMRMNSETGLLELPPSYVAE